MKKLFNGVLLCILFFTCSLNANAQDDFRKAFEKYCENDATMTRMMSQGLEENISKIIDAVGNTTGKSSQELAKKYVETQFRKDMIDLLEPVYREKLTTSDLNELNKLNSTPESKAMQAHSAQLVTTIHPLLQPVITKAVMDILAGKTPEQVKVNVSNKRQKYFHTVYENYGMDSIVENIMQGLKQMTAQVPNQELLAKMMNEIGSYMKDNMEALMANASEGILTDADLEFANKVNNTPAGKKAIEASKSIFGDILGFAGQMQDKVKAFVAKQ